jgi:hypothetical protein
MRVQYTKQDIERAVRNSKTWREVISYLNPKSNYKGSQSHIKNRAIKFGIDFSHFLGSAWNKGKKFPPKVNISEYLANGKFIQSNNLKRRLINDNIKKYECEECKLSEWRKKPIPLELHHIDHNPKNNELSNLKILCSNCHSLEHKNFNIKIKKSKILQKQNKCMICSNKCYKKFCSLKCYHQSRNGIERKHTWKTNRPNKDELSKLIQEMSFLQIGKKYNVSDNAVRKWCKFYNIDMSISKFKIKK